MIVGDDFHTLPAANAAVDLFGPDWLDGPPACLEFRVRSASSEGSGLDTIAIRVPIAAGAEAEARAVLNHYQRRSRMPITGEPPPPPPPPPAEPVVEKEKNWRLRRNLGLLMAAVGAAGVWLAWSRLPAAEAARDAETQAALMIGIAFGVLMVPIGILVAVLCHREVRPAK